MQADDVYSQDLACVLAVQPLGHAITLLPQGKGLGQTQQAWSANSLSNSLPDQVLVSPYANADSSTGLDKPTHVS